MDGLRVGYGECIITPRLGLDLSGYGFYLDRKAEGVLDDLKVRALHLTSNGRTLILAVSDLIGLTVEFADRVRAEIAAAHHLPVSHVLLACTHTHSGPATQSMPGLGTMDRAYMRTVEARIREAADRAVTDAKEAGCAASFEAIEPIGYNRRTGDFQGIDPMLGLVTFYRRDGAIHLFNYACHAVVFGPRRHVSADWPGAVIREVETRGDRAVFLQGFCGDIDPVTQKNRWGEGTSEDLALYGTLIARRLEKAEKFGAAEPAVALAASERRLAIALRVYGKREIERVSREFERKNSRFPGARRFAADWKRRALENYASLRRRPYVENVPIQAMAIGRSRILAFPGEVFCGIGLKLRETWPSLVPAGYADGNIGYIPTRRAYRDPDDYASWGAPLFYQIFPFTPDVESLVLQEGRRLLRTLNPR